MGIGNGVLSNSGGCAFVSGRSRVWSNYGGSTAMTISKSRNVLSAAPFIGVTKGSNTPGCILLMTSAFKFCSTFFCSLNIKFNFE